jgi:hypothetical protein
VQKVTPAIGFVNEVSDETPSSSGFWITLRPRGGDAGMAAATPLEMCIDSLTNSATVFSKTVPGKSRKSKVLLIEDKAAASEGIRAVLAEAGSGRFDVECVRQLSDGLRCLNKGGIEGMGKNLKQRVIAEGIETQEQLAFLRSRRCAEGQGYLFSGHWRPHLLLSCCGWAYRRPLSTECSVLCIPLWSLRIGRTPRLGVSGRRILFHRT